MATVTDPIMLDSTGQDIKDQISALNTKIQTLNTLLADLGLVSITPISQEDYDALSQAEKLAGVFDIYNAAEPDIDGTKVSYNSNTNVVQKIDELNDKVTSLFVKDSLEIPTFTVNAGTYADKTATIPTKTGYTPVAVSEWMLRTATGTLTRATLNASNMELTITVGNPTQAAISPNPYFSILYIKNNT